MTEQTSKAPPWTREQIVERLVGDGTRPDLATVYADLWLEYWEASENIGRNGVIVQHPRTLNPIENPYVRQRDKARAGLVKLGGRVKAAWLWGPGRG